MHDHLVKSQVKGKKKAIALVCHGLNLNPERMQPLSDALTELRVENYRLKLTGHRGDLEEMREVTPALWLKEVYESYRIVKKHAEEQNLPFYYVGYSLGGVLGTMMLETELPGKVSFDKMLLLAPAVSVKGFTRLVLITKIFGNRALMPTFSLKDYRANDGVSVAAYDALFAYIKALDESKEHKNLNIPTLVLMDPRDELISLSGIKSLIKERNLDQWQIGLLKKDPKPKKNCFNHLILGPDSMGKKGWQNLVKQISDFLR